MAYNMVWKLAFGLVLMKLSQAQESTAITSSFESAVTSGPLLDIRTPGWFPADTSISVTSLASIIAVGPVTTTIELICPTPISIFSAAGPTGPYHALTNEPPYCDFDRLTLTMAPSSFAWTWSPSTYSPQSFTIEQQCTIGTDSSASCTEIGSGIFAYPASINGSNDQVIGDEYTVSEHSYSLDTTVAVEYFYTTKAVVTAGIGENVSLSGINGSATITYAVSETGSASPSITPSGGSPSNTANKPSGPTPTTMNSGRILAPDSVVMRLVGLALVAYLVL